MKPEDEVRHDQMVTYGHDAEELPMTGSDLIEGLKDPGIDVGKFIG